MKRMIKSDYVLTGADLSVKMQRILLYQNRKKKLVEMF